jgi:hypothetical protein
MTVAEMKEILDGYRDEMELYIVVEDRIGSRRQLLGINDYSARPDSVFLSGILSRVSLPKVLNQKLQLM